MVVIVWLVNIVEYKIKYEEDMVYPFGLQMGIESIYTVSPNCENDDMVYHERWKTQYGKTWDLPFTVEKPSAMMGKLESITGVNSYGSNSV